MWPVRRSVATGTDGSLHKPSGAVVGDYLIAIATQGATAIPGAPAGWEELVGSPVVVGSAIRLHCYHKPAAAADTATWALGVTAVSAVAAYQGVDLSDPIGEIATLATLASTSPVADEIATTAVGAMVLALFGMDISTTLTAPARMTEIADVNNGTTLTVAAYEITKYFAGPTGQKTATAAGSGNAAAFTIALRARDWTAPNPSGGFVNDADTGILWRGAEPAIYPGSGPLDTAWDQSDNAFHLGPDAGGDAIGIVGGRNGRAYARLWPGAGGDQQFISAAGDSAEIAAGFDEEWTILARIRVDDLGAERSVVGFGAGGDTAAANYRGRLTIETNGAIQSFWEHGAGTDETVTQASSPFVTVGTWHTVSIECKANESNPTTERDVTIRLDGAVVHSEAGIAKGDNGTSSRLRVGDDPSNTGLNFVGAIEQVAIYTAVLTQDEHEAYAAADDFPFRAGETHALYGFITQPDAIDSAEGGTRHHLKHRFGSSNRVTVLNRGAAQPGCKPSKASANTAIMEAYASEELRTLFTGAWTIEAWIRPVPDFSGHGDADLLAYWADTATETQAGNILAAVWLESDLRVSVLWEHSGGTNVTWTSTLPLVSGAEALASPVLVGLVKEDLGGGNYMLHAYGNGVFVESSGSLQGPDGGTSAEMRLTVLAGATGVAPGVANFIGYLGAVRVSGVERSADEMEESYTLGGTCGGGTPPTVTIISPPNGSGLATRTTPIVLRVEDLDDGIGRIVITARLVNGVEEVVYARGEDVADGGFQGRYLGSEVTGNDTAGYEFTVVRLGGWPLRSSVDEKTVEFFIMPVDRSGNVAGSWI